MSMVIDTKDYKAEYEKAYLQDTLSLPTQRARASIFLVSTLLLIANVYNAEGLSIPGFSTNMPQEVPYLAKGMLTISVWYLAIKFLVCFSQDYLRWNHRKSIATILISRKAVDQVNQLKRDLRSDQEDVNSSLCSGIDKISDRLEGSIEEISGIKRKHRFMKAAHFLRVWLLELALPVLITSLALLTSDVSLIFVARDVWNAL
ncbi:hypothetical protein [Spongiibacter marinus]|uniref:hypothetical protein n=1 Tax=Spongiibacter marinus TaxID=354246 RepID=UPI003C6B6BF0